MSITINKTQGNSGFFVSKSGITIVGEVKKYKTISERNNAPVKPKYAIVEDATEDPTVKKGSAVYTYADGAWAKIYESEVMDPVNPWDADTFLADANGFSQLPNGILFQWGTTADIVLSPGESKEISAIFPTTFPTNVFNISATINGTPDVVVGVISRNQTLAVMKIKNNSTDPETIKLTYQAIGH